MAGTDLAALGIPAADAHLRRYTERRGLGAIDPDVWNYHLVYNLFRPLGWTVIRLPISVTVERALRFATTA